MICGPSNPFATRFTAPGRIGPRDHDGRTIDIDVVLDQLSSLGGTAAIVGPHGSGKSTLLVHLADTLERRGRRVRRVRLRSWRDAATALSAIRGSSVCDTVCIDSWDCAGFAVRGVLRMAARLSGCGLLVTAHRDVGLPTLLQCRPTVGLLRAIVLTLPAKDRWYGTWIRESDVSAAFAAHGGNLREALYDLYDRFEVSARHDRERRRDGCDAGDGRTAGGCEIHECLDGFSHAGASERNLG